ncbi:hypothetical protein CC78DRAFT_476725 [Lojkania enalia]|uniref:Rhodopsin domain-containing protein n=1 Tax=Lojkania enalia TaxID=147567 RepID=A0A9P4JYK4_9PLEO|nr:hypothetical protein CC78DRAFT_476725 [Didymosphaeria enalia]
MNTSFVSTSLMGVAISLPILASFAVALRFYARKFKGNGCYRMDDWFILVTLIFCWGHSINTIVAGAIGGIDRITMPPHKYANVALRTLWISSFFLITPLYTVKVSILLFYHHLFSIKRWFRNATYVLLVVITLWWASSIILVFLSTTPIEAAWKNAAGAKHRFDYNTWYISYGALSVFFDVGILCVPIPMIKSLKMSLKQKVSILAIFWLGGFVCVAAIVRLVYLVNSMGRLQNSFGRNLYSQITAAFIWAEIEPNVAVIAACLPCYGPIFTDTRFARMIRSVKSILHISTKSGQKLQPSRLTNTKRSSYYELDKRINSNRDTSAILRDKGGKSITLQTEISVDIETQKSLDSEKVRDRILKV